MVLALWEYIVFFDLCPLGHPTTTETRGIDKTPTGNIDTDTYGSIATATQSYHAHYSSANSTKSASDR